MPFITQGKTNVKYLLIVALVAAIAGGIIFSARNSCYKDIVNLNNFVEIKVPEKKSAQEQGCIDSRGTASVSQCCKSVGDFPNSCLVGACSCSSDNSYQVKVCNCEEGKCFDGEKCSPIETPKTGLIQASFSYPYPVSWTWDSSRNDIADFSLTEVSLGERTVPSFVHSAIYKPGDKIYALTLNFKINTHWDALGIDLYTEQRLILNEEGDKMAPINLYFNVQSLGGKKTYYDQEVIFVVPKTQKVFTFTTGGSSNIFFTVKILDDGRLQVGNSVACATDKKLCPDGSYVNRISPSCEFIECPAADTESLIQESFSYPYPLSWTQEGRDNEIMNFSLTAISLGERTVPSFVHSAIYKPGGKIYALTLYLNLKLDTVNTLGWCIHPDVRVILNEEGDSAGPINDYFNEQCPVPNKIFAGQEEIFVVLRTEKTFTLTTGGKSNIFFTVTVLDDGHLKVEKLYTGSQG